mgnify:CR=1 FL=1
MQIGGCADVAAAVLEEVLDAEGGGGPIGRWTEVLDEWDESKPELSCAATPPEGLIQPKRGFGLAWCSQPAMRDALGYALTIEESTDARMQQVESGYLLYHVARGTAYLLRPDGAWAGLAAP